VATDLRVVAQYSEVWTSETASIRVVAQYVEAWTTELAVLRTAAQYVEVWHLVTDPAGSGGSATGAVLLLGL
jgi:hypothetical protein